MGSRARRSSSAVPSTKNDRTTRQPSIGTYIGDGGCAFLEEEVPDGAEEVAAYYEALLDPIFDE